MNSSIQIYKYIIPDLLCTEIIELFETNNKSNIVIIPKDNDKWIRIERFIYKNLLEKINDYKKNIIININQNNNTELHKQINDDIYVKNFTIQYCDSKNTYESYNRQYVKHSVVNFVFYLSECDNGTLEFTYKNISIQPTPGVLVLFPDYIDYKYKIPTCNHYVITGQFVSLMS